MKKPIAQPFQSIDELVDEKDVAAIHALAAGVASEGQQKLALALIVNRICGTYDLSFRPGGSEGERLTTFAEGKRYVGLAIVRLTKLVKQKP